MATALSHRLFGGAFLMGIALTGCVSQSKYDTLQAENQQLQQELAAERGQITRLQGAIKYTINSDLLFAPGSWQMSAEGEQTLGKFAQKLAPTQENMLVVNGYTDNAPIGAELEQKGITSNEELSQKRAEAVKQFLIAKGVPSNLILAVGRGETNPVATNDTAKGRAQNRRVELSLGG
jgi:chemotaxis protein MotB